MTPIQPIRSLFTNGIIVLVILLVLVEAVSWNVSTEAKLNFVNENGGALSYFSLLVRNAVLPETTTVFTLALLMNWIRDWANIKLSDTSWESLILYQLGFLPILLTAFVLFVPLTQSIRYLLIEFPNYSFNYYWHKYILDSYSLAMYFRYLFPVVFIGYGALNLSLITGSLGNHPVKNSRF